MPGAEATQCGIENAGKQWRPVACLSDIGLQITRDIHTFKGLMDFETEFSIEFGFAAKISSFKDWAISGNPT